MSGAPKVIGVVGAGTMGSGIAQLGALSGARTLLFDADAGAVERALERIPQHLDRGAERGRWSAEDAAGARDRLEGAGALEDLAECELIVEAAPESLELKRELFGSLSEIAPAAVLASNTSSIPITSIAPAAADPTRVVGMHFFNPPPLMRLRRGHRRPRVAPRRRWRSRAPRARRWASASSTPPTSPASSSTAATGRSASRRRSCSPSAPPTSRRSTASAALDGGFRMGPFELSDLVGVDVGFEIAKSFYELSFGEPRWRPNPLVAKLVAAGPPRPQDRPRLVRLRATARTAPTTPSRPRPDGGDGRLVVIAGDLPIAEELRGLAASAGYAAVEPLGAEGDVPWLADRLRRRGRRPAAPGRPARDALRRRLAARARPGRRRGRLPRAAAARRRARSSS